MLLGGSGKFTTKMNREITEIEQSILDGLFRIILHDLKLSWQAVANLDFTVEAHETEPQLLQILAPNEAVVAISMEVRIGDNSGMINLGVPSIIIKMLRQKFDQQWSVRKSESTVQERERILRLIKPVAMLMDARLQGPTLTVAELLEIQGGDILTFDFPTGKPLDLLINSKLKYRGHVATNGRKKAFRVEQLYNPAD
jgi:flagellar motor switch protein FliM